MERTHIKPFKSAIDSGAQMIMAAHLHCKCFENEPIPTSLSKNALDYLRNNLGFSGVIISDDMVMKGVSKFGDVDACIMGIKEGLNMFIYRYSDDKTMDIIEKVYQLSLKDNLLRQNIETSFDKIMNLKSIYCNIS